ncbi:MAG: hypothetical protein JWO22_682 [Frankiales bacterium]|nr:hypothetical protein [Frankiales bacterium]
MSHPVATAEQHEHELAALELIEHPTVQAARKQIADRWLERADPSPAMREAFPAAFEEVMFSAAIWSSNQNPLRPKVTCITRLEHTVDGRRVPGSRWGIDNPDTVYRVIPISGEERYVIRGRVGAQRMTENYFTLWDSNMLSLDVLNGTTMEVDSDGSFEITVGPEVVSSNHITTQPTAKELYVRDVLLDWGRDDPNAFTVERIGGNGAAWTLDDQAQRTADMMAYFADFTGKLAHGAYKLPPNRFSMSWTADHSGGLRNQVYVMGRYELADDEAFVVDVSDGGAKYFTVPLGNKWGTTLDILDRTGSLNKAQSAPNADGTYTYVISATDPGVHNWIDTGGLPEGLLTLRMAEFPAGGATEDLSAQGRVVKLDELPELPSVDRAAQLAERRSAYLRRLPEAV